MLISVVILIKNNEFYINYLNQIFSTIENKNNLTFEYYIYENNSSDNTKINLANFMKNRKGICFLENLKTHTSFNGGISIERGKHMANLRNTLKKKHGILKSQYTLLLDSDVLFNDKTFDKILDVFKANKDIVMTTTYSLCGNAILNNILYHYYDTLALKLNNGFCYKTSNNKCPFKECIRCVEFRKKYNIQIPENMLINIDGIIDVKSAFGGFCVIKTEVYNNCSWGDTICEHHSFCESVSKEGRIVIASNIKTLTTIPEFKNDPQKNIAVYNKMLSILNKFY